MAVTQYIGARYVPFFAEPLEWDITKEYEPLTIVYYQGNSYTSRRSVPSNINITDTNYWAITGNYNAQIEQYRLEVTQMQAQVEAELDEALAQVDETVADIKTTFKESHNARLIPHGVCAHRGYMDIAPENSKAAFIEAGLARCHFCETDIHPTQDGKIVCMHDDTINRTTNGTGNVADYTLAQLKEFLLIDNNTIYSEERIPTLEEYLTICFQYNMTPLIEIKRGYTVTEDFLTELFKQLDYFNGRYKVIFHSWGEAQLDALKEYDDNLFCLFVTRMTSHNDVQKVLDKYDGITYDITNTNNTWLLELYNAGKYIMTFNGIPDANWTVTQPYINTPICDNPFENITRGGTFNNKDAAFNFAFAGYKGERYTVYSNNFLAPMWFDEGIIFNEVSKNTATTSKADDRFPSFYLGKFDSYDVIQLNNTFGKSQYFINADDASYISLGNVADYADRNLFAWSPILVNNGLESIAQKNTFYMINFGATVLSGSFLNDLKDCIEYKRGLSNHLRANSYLPIGSKWNVNTSGAQAIAPGKFINRNTFYPVAGKTSFTINNKSYADVNNEVSFICRTYEIVDGNMTLIKDYAWHSVNDTVTFTNDESSNNNAYLVVWAVARTFFRSAAWLPMENNFYLVNGANTQTITLNN